MELKIKYDFKENDWVIGNTHYDFETLELIINSESKVTKIYRTSNTEEIVSSIKYRETFKPCYFFDIDFKLFEDDELKKFLNDKELTFEFNLEAPEIKIKGKFDDNEFYNELKKELLNYVDSKLSKPVEIDFKNVDVISNHNLKKLIKDCILEINNGV